jgi:hypothetical protein
VLHGLPIMEVGRDKTAFGMGFCATQRGIFSSMILALMLGNYLFQMFARGSGAVSTPESALQGLLVVSSGACLLGAVFQRAGFALLCAVVVLQLCMGGYWPCVGYYRCRLLMHEQRSTVIVLSRYVDLCVVRCPAVYVVCVTVPHRSPHSSIVTMTRLDSFF